MLFGIFEKFCFLVDAESYEGVLNVVVDGVYRKIERVGDLIFVVAHVPQSQDTKLCIANLVVEGRAAYNIFEPAFSSKRTWHALQVPGACAVDILHVVNIAEITPYKPFDNSDTSAG